MKIYLTLLLLVLHIALRGQVVTTEPKFLTKYDDITVYFNAAEGNAGLLNVPPPIYAHAGLITDQSSNGSDWKFVQGEWGKPDPKILMTPVGPNLYAISYNILDFYGAPESTDIQKLAFVFRNEDGSKAGREGDGSDIFVDVFDNSGALFTVLEKPTIRTQLVGAGAVIPVIASASKPSDFRLLDNGVQLKATTGTTFNSPIFVSGSGFHEVLLITEAGTEVDTQRFTYTILTPTIEEPVPADLLFGANRTGPGQVTLQLYAPNKSHAYVLCNLNGYTFRQAYQMKRDPGKEIYWLTIEDIPPGTDLIYQYAVNGSTRVADPYSELILDPVNDGGIPSSTFPDIPPYPFGLVTGHLSWLRMDPPEYAWQSNDFERPPVEGLVLYELMVRDFLEERSFGTLLDTLDYLKRLGVNVVQLMPVNEFENNLSWGYNVSYHGALDKYYGSPEALKSVVDGCHQRGMAVILDVVYNHAFGQSPLCQLYWNPTTNQPAADSPYANAVAKHPFNVGYDLNHESLATRTYVKQTLDHWIGEFRIDGFRFDLSKGFTQVDSGDDVGLWGQYDASRIAILKDYADHIWSWSPNLYVTLEHFGSADEEIELANYGMMLWGNMSGPYAEAAMGYSGNSLRGVTHKSRGFAQPHLIGYMESHDEERMSYKIRTFGNSNMDYDTRTDEIAPRRAALATVFLLTLPGPKMLWQFSELGYDLSLFTCSDGVTINNPDCKLDPKPVPWYYYQEQERRALFNEVRSLNHLRQVAPVFTQGDWDNDELKAGAQKVLHLVHPTMNAVVMGNFDIVGGTVDPAFPQTGWWYDYFGGDSLLVTDVHAPMDLQPGEYRIYTSAFVPLPEGDLGTSTADPVGDPTLLQVIPNPSSSAWLVRMSALGADEGELVLRDVLGRVLDRQRLTPLDGQVTWEGDAALPPGSYWLSWEGPHRRATIPVLRMGQ